MFHPLEKAATTDQVEWKKGVVEVDEAGSRWVRVPGKSPEVTAFGAPEALVAVAAERGALASVGESGAVYFSEEALSPFVEVRTPPEKFVMTRRAGDTLLAISAGGAIQRSVDWGKHWDVVSSDAHFAELATASDGTVLAVSVPEQWHLSTDAGMSFALQDLPTQAPRHLGRLRSGEIFVEGLYQTSLYRERKFEPAARSSSDPLFRRTPAKEYQLPSYPRASPIVQQRAVLLGRDYVWLKPATPGRPWKLERGALDRQLVSSEVTGLEACDDFRFVGAGDHTAVVCQAKRGAEISPLVEIYRASKLGGNYTRVVGARRGSLGHLRLAMSRQGDLAIAGLCITQEKGCGPSGTLVLSETNEEHVVHVPGVIIPSAIAMGRDGRLWLAGRRDKDGHFLVFAHPVGTDAPGVLLDLSRDADFPEGPTAEHGFDLRLLPGDDKLISVVLRGGQAGKVAVVNAQGELISTGNAPSASQQVHGAGRFLVALDEGDEVLWESTTGGLSWTKQVLPRKLCDGSRSECAPAVICSEAGCLVGDELSRLGFGSSDSAARPPLPFDASQQGQGDDAPGYDCTAEGADWTELRGLVAVPSAHDAMLGEAAWAGSLQSTEQAALTAIQVPLGETAIKREVLLAPVPPGDTYAFHVSSQVEGVAAVRFPVASPSRSRVNVSSGAGDVIEVAWDNRIAGVFGVASLKHPQAVATSSLLSGLSMLRPSAPELLSVAGQGIYLRLASRQTDGNPTFFLRGRGPRAVAEELGGVDWPRGNKVDEGWISDPFLQASVRTERVRVGGQHAALAMYAGGRVLSVARGIDSSAGAATFSPYLMGLLGADTAGYAQNVGIAYSGQDVGFVSLQVNLDGPGHRASFVRLDATKGFAAPVPVPLQQDLALEVRPCSAAVRASTPRVIAPGVFDRGRRVTVTGASPSSIELSTDRAVLFGTPEEPCVGAFDGRSTRDKSAEATRYWVLVYPGELGSSWLFRETNSLTLPRQYAARRLLCRPEVGALN